MTGYTVIDFETTGFSPHGHDRVVEVGVVSCCGQADPAGTRPRRPRVTQEAVARLSGTSQPTVSAYERGAESPTLAVAQRILHALDFELGLQPRVTFREVRRECGRTYVVPNQLWRVDPPGCFAAIDGLDASGEPGG